jgi:hypothetical protein
VKWPRWRPAGLTPRRKAVVRQIRLRFDADVEGRRGGSRRTTYRKASVTRQPSWKRGQLPRKPDNWTPRGGSHLTGWRRGNGRWGRRTWQRSPRSAPKIRTGAIHQRSLLSDAIAPIDVAARRRRQAARRPGGVSLPGSRLARAELEAPLGAAPPVSLEWGARARSPPSSSPRRGGWAFL